MTTVSTGNKVSTSKTRPKLRTKTVSGEIKHLDDDGEDRYSFIAQVSSRTLDVGEMIDSLNYLLKSPVLKDLSETSQFIISVKASELGDEKNSDALGEVFRIGFTPELLQDEDAMTEVIPR